MQFTLTQVSGILVILRWGAVLVLTIATTSHAQSTATLRGTIKDPNGAVLADATITATNKRIGVQRATRSDKQGSYEIVALPIGSYQAKVHAPGFATLVADDLSLEVATTVTLDFQLQVGDINQLVRVQVEADVVQHGTITVGQVIDQRIVQDSPLNGRHFIDLGLLIPGSVTPPQNGFLAPPARGQGSFALNTAGNREDTVNFQINGINLNDQINNIITFLPPISSIAEFKIDNSTFSAVWS